MAYHLDPTNGDLIVDGFQNGIGTDPYSGLTDMRSVNPLSVPNEASVSFATSSIFKNPLLVNNATGSLITTSSGQFLAPLNLLIEQGQFITFSNLGGAIGSGLATGTTYLLSNGGLSGLNGWWTLYTLAGVFVTVTTASTSAVIFSTINPSQPKYFAKSLQSNFMVDSSGLVWSDIVTTTGGGNAPATHSWTWMKNTTNGDPVANANGNGLLVYRSISGSTTTGKDEWLFVWRNSAIDYTQITQNGAATAISWVYGWNPALVSGTNTGKSEGYLNNSNIINSSHEAIITPDGTVTYCDNYFVSHFYQLAPATAGSSYTAFDPKTQSTFFFSTYAILPINDVAQSLTFLGSNVLIGGKLNAIYPWDLLSNHYITPVILLPESNTAHMVTVGNNAYIFCGNRGNIYVTNGSQASFFVKVPDHISGEIEPLYSWAGATGYGGIATYNKNRLYFGCQVYLQAGGTSNGYGGVWCVDLVTNAIFQAQQLSYGNYNGFVSAIGVPAPSSNYVYGASIGYGLLVGWGDNLGYYGADADILSPYTGTRGQSYIVSDMIPVGTLFKPMTATQIEFKLSAPLKTGESVQLLMGSSLDDLYGSGSMTPLTPTTTGTSSPYTTSDGSNPPILSANLPITVQKQQWLLVQVILTSITSNPSYCRLTQIRIIGDTVKTQVAGQPYANV